MFENINIPNGSVVGINYSGMHDTSVSIVSPEGRPIFAISQERISRVKMDGKFPNEIIKGIPWGKISKVALACEKKYTKSENNKSNHHPVELINQKDTDKNHGKEFYSKLKAIPLEITFVPHHLAHASSSYWLSGYDESLCLIYDGGMSNEEWFGGIYFASTETPVTPLDLFSSLRYGNITKIYTTVTALLGYRPLRHEGKITGLSAHGKVNSDCLEIFNNWLLDPTEIDLIFEWKNVYSDNLNPYLSVNKEKIRKLIKTIEQYSPQDIAATVQYLAEYHVDEILNSIIESVDIKDKKLCLAGGLFSNVRINQLVANKGFSSIFVTPPMTDDGAGLGAALHVISKNKKIKPKRINSIYLGEEYSSNEVENLLNEYNVIYHKPVNPELEIAELLSNKSNIAIFQGKMEFGPRSLGNRSILASASDVSSNNSLNKLLHRTEFMPFAPVCLKENEEILFKDLALQSSDYEFMTITAYCSDFMRKTSPAVVHIDGTARPQFIDKNNNKLIYNILKNYINKTGLYTLINTSFNIHEEPIIRNPSDAIKGFFESGLDALYIEGILILRNKNTKSVVDFMKNKIDNLMDERKNEINLLTIELEEAREYKISIEKTLEIELKKNEILMSKIDKIRNNKIYKVYKKINNVAKLFTKNI